MLTQLLKELNAYRYIVEADVNYEGINTCTAVVKHKFLMGREWKTLGYVMGSFSETQFELNWLDFHLPHTAKEFIEHRSLEAIKKRICLLWGMERMIAFENIVEASRFQLKKTDS